MDPISKNLFIIDLKIVTLGITAQYSSEMFILINPITRKWLETRHALRFYLRYLGIVDGRLFRTVPAPITRIVIRTPGLSSECVTADSLSLIVIDKLTVARFRSSSDVIRATCIYIVEREHFHVDRI